MQALRNVKTIARFVLVWFALALGAAIASPLVKPQPIELICTGSGVMKIVPADDDDDGGASTVVASTLDCPMCASLGVPPVSARQVAQPLDTQSYAPQGVAAAHVAARAASPLPARGPPAFS
jgi:hypothetical protein